MKIATILGTRPEIIRLSRTIERLDACCDHVLIHTEQNFDTNLSEVFFEELGLRAPDHCMGLRLTRAGEQIGAILRDTETLLADIEPHRILVLGDTNSGLATFMAKRMGIPVFHMEAGNRCFDDRVPEEVNRRVIDQCSDVLMPYTEHSRRHLLREGFADRRIFVIGNPIFEVLRHYREQISQSSVLQSLELSSRSYFLATVHRAENVDAADRLGAIFSALSDLAEKHDQPCVVSVHPRTAQRLSKLGPRISSEHLLMLPAMGLFDFVHLERHARCVLTDSGTVQEECCIFGVPAVTLRDVTERPETLECGSNMLAGADPRQIDRAADVMMARDGWQPPSAYTRAEVSSTVAQIVTGFYPDLGRD